MIWDFHLAQWLRQEYLGQVCDICKTVGARFIPIDFRGIRVPGFGGTSAW